MHEIPGGAIPQFYCRKCGQYLQVDMEDPYRLICPVCGRSFRLLEEKRSP